MSKPTIAERLEVAEQDAAAFFQDCTNLQKRLDEAKRVLKLIADKKGMTMLGECCPTKSCMPQFDPPAVCTHAAGVNRGYAECAGEATAYFDKHKKG